jgi:photosystem II stability/assembly factor-like uncharacterized protein
MIEYYKKRVEAGDTSMKAELNLAKENGGNGLGDLPWLSVWFQNKTTGYAVGSFGNIVKTRDGGRHWIPWLHHIKNPNEWHLNEIIKLGDKLYIAAEGGVVFKWSSQSSSFEPMQTPYKGDLFGITGDKKKIVAFGLGGHIYESTDQGVDWLQVHAPIGHAGINAGTRLSDGRIVLVTEYGQVAISVGDAARKFKLLPVKRPMIFTDVIQVRPDALLVVGMKGTILSPLHTDAD